MKFTIDRSKWIVGSESKFPRPQPKNTMSYLFRGTDKKKCCIGHYLSAIGLPDKILLDMVDPNSIQSCVKETAGAWLLMKNTYEIKIDEFMNSESADELMMRNDDPVLPDKQREDEITDIFSEHGIEVEFVGAYI